ncbi:MAG TPA: penicillin-binding protein activator, partial [Methylophilaceae bacterium]|nr:penicillin-binding protein activator [Methylophilaceae bacterium]
DAIKMYATHGNAAEIAGIYQQAIAEGATYVVGPLTRNEVSALTTLPIPVPTLALNEPESMTANPQLHALGLSVEAEAAQVADLARSYGMQTAIIVASDNPLGSHMANAFSEAWIKQGGQIKLQAVITHMSDLEDLKAQIADQPADMIFLAADAAEARAIRPHLDIATPTFALSHVYSGLPHDPLDKPLLAVRFVDMPWLLNPDDPAFAPYKAAASDLPPGKMQRWFALGVDAYHLLQELVRHPGQPFSISGLTGKINVSADGSVSRELATGSFGSNGIVLEDTP